MLILTNDAAVTTGPFQSPACEALAPSLAASLLDQCQRQAASLQAVDVVTRDRKGFLRDLRLEMVSLSPGDGGLGALLLLTGPAQSGKATILKTAMTLLPAPLRDTWTLTRPVLRLSLCAQATGETLIWGAIAALDPIFAQTVPATKIDANRDGARLLKLLGEFRVEWLVINRAEALADNNLGKQNLIATFLGDLRGSGVSIILCGRDPAVALVERTPEWAVGVVHRQIYAYDKPKDPEFRTFVNAFLGRGPVASSISDEESWQSLIEATAGLRGHIKSVVKRAMMIAVSNRAEAVTVEHVKKALHKSVRPRVTYSPSSKAVADEGRSGRRPVPSTRRH